MKLSSLAVFFASAELVTSKGPLRTFEENMEKADDNLLKDNNFTFVPPIPVLKTIANEYRQNHRLSEDIFTEIRILKRALAVADISSNDFSGYIRTTGEDPFTVHLMCEAQILRYINYCRSVSYSFLHLDATGSVIRKITEQKSAFFYSCIYKDDDDPSCLLPLASALLCDNTVTGIHHFLLNIRKHIVIIKRVFVRPSFIIVDFSHALINAVLSSFNNMDINTYLQICFNILQCKYTRKKLKALTIIRMCCAHAIHAFARNLAKFQIPEKRRHPPIKLFALLLNTNESEQIFELFAKICAIFGDPQNCNAEADLDPILCVKELLKFDLEKYLCEDEEGDVLQESQVKGYQVEDLTISTSAIIHQSPFNIEMRKRTNILEHLLEKNKTKQNQKQKPTNPLYSPKILLLFYKWFAYVPLWSCVFLEFKERYASDRNDSSPGKRTLGGGRVSNAPIESYFEIIKESVLQKKTRKSLYLRPGDFITKLYTSVMARLKAGKYNVQQQSTRKKGRKRVTDVLLSEKWGESNKRKNRGRYFAKHNQNSYVNK
ncbi:unnamed protein product, partial [Didymodactylos carnosus]